MSIYWGEKKRSKQRSGILVKTAGQASISLERVIAVIGSFSTFVLHGKLRRKRDGEVRHYEHRGERAMLLPSPDP